LIRLGAEACRAEVKGNPAQRGVSTGAARTVAAPGLQGRLTGSGRPSEKFFAEPFHFSAAHPSSSM